MKRNESVANTKTRLARAELVKEIYAIFDVPCYTYQESLDISLEIVLDSFALLQQYLPNLKAAVLHAHASEMERYDAVLALYGDAARERLPASLRDSIQKNISTNLKRVGKVSDSLLEFIKQLLEYSTMWRFLDEASIEHIPTLPGTVPMLYVSERDAATIRRLAYAHFPPCILDLRRIAELRHTMFHAPIPLPLSTGAPPPLAIVMVGLPGAGKGAVIEEINATCFQDEVIKERLKGNVHIDPDSVINCFGNDNALRPLADNINHENFLITIAQRRPLIFDGTGKGPLNTCGRVIGRLSRAGYEVRLYLIATSFTTCLDRISRRALITGRSVPRGFVEAAAKALAKSVPAYLENLEGLASEALLFDGDATPSEIRYKVPAGCPRAQKLEAADFMCRRLGFPCAEILPNSPQLNSS